MKTISTHTESAGNLSRNLTSNKPYPSVVSLHLCFSKERVSIVSLDLPGGPGGFPPPGCCSTALVILSFLPVVMPYNHNTYGNYLKTSLSRVCAITKKGAHFNFTTQKHNKEDDNITIVYHHSLMQQ
jgi:hypothetical protein